MAPPQSRRQHLLGALTLVAGAGVAACAGPGGPGGSGAAETLPAPSGKPVEIDYWHRVTGDAARALEDHTAAFNQQQAGKIKVTSTSQGSIADLNKKVRAAAAGGGLPGATMGDDYDVTQYAFSKVITPLDPYIGDRQHGLTREQREDFLPNQLDRHKLAIYDGKTMAYPQGFSAFTTFWNVDALRRAGADSPPRTWREFPDHVRAVARANKDLAGWYIGGAGDRYISTLLTHGVDWLAADGKSTNFDRPAALEIMTWWRQLSDERLLAVPKESARDAFVAQRCAYFMDSSGNANAFFTLVKDFAWNAAIPPQGTAGTKITETYGPVNALPKTDPDRQLAGWQWLKWLVTPEPHARYVIATSYFPSIRSAAESPALRDYYQTNTTFARLFADVAPNARILGPNPALTEVRGTITANVVNEVLLGQLTPDQGVKKLKAEADRAVRAAAQ